MSDFLKYLETFKTREKITVECAFCKGLKTSIVANLKKEYLKRQKLACKACSRKYLSKTSNKIKKILTLYDIKDSGNMRGTDTVTYLNSCGHPGKSTINNLLKKKSILCQACILAICNRKNKEQQVRTKKTKYIFTSSPTKYKLVKINGCKDYEELVIKVVTWIETNEISPNSKKAMDHFKCNRETLRNILKYGNRIDLLTAYNKPSHQEDALYRFVKDHYQGPILRNSRNIIPPKELDVYLPELKIAFEFNGLWWHSDKSVEKNYHLEKWRSCLAKGISLFSIWEHEWGEAWENTIKKLVTPKKVLYARKTTITKDKQAIQVFIEKDHIQGKTFAQEAIGLEFEGSIVAALTIAPHHRKGSEEMVLNRVCFGEYSVVGGLDKMLKALEYRGLLTTWSNNCYAPNPTLYKNSGFKKIAELPPDYFYVDKNGKYHSKQSKRKQLIGCPPEETEYNFLKSQGFHRVWDCGKIKWSKEV